MARRTRKAASSKRSVDFSAVGKPFEKDMDVHLVIKEAAWAEGQAGDYLAIKFNGVEDEYTDSELYHNASFAPKALPRTRAFLEALGLDVDGEMEIDADELVGLEVMATTYEDRYDGGKSIKADEFWPAEEKPKAKGKAGKGKRAAKDDDDEKPAKGAKGKKPAKEPDPEPIDFDAMDDDDVKALGKKFKIKAKKPDDIRAELVDIDEDDIREAAEELDITIGEEEVEEKKPKGKASSKAGSKKSSKKATWASEDVMEMSEEELEEVIETSGIDVDLDDHKTLRKKKNAVIDALTEADLLDD